MIQTQSVPTMPFAAIIEDALRQVLPSRILNLAAPEILESHAFKVLETPLVYLLNEQRLEGRLPHASPEEQYEAFVASTTVLKELQQRFPDCWNRWLVIAATLEKTLAAVELRIAEDSPLVASLLGGAAAEEPVRVLAVRPMGDIHPQGMVCQVVTSAGTVYYKPRPAGNEEFVAAIAGWLGDHVHPGAWLGIKLPVVLDRGDYTWVEQVEHQPLADASDASAYYRRAGHLLGLGYVVNLSDMHHENVIATATHPVPVDLETIMSVPPRTTKHLTAAEAAALQNAMSTPAATGLLPMGASLDELGGNVSGLGADSLRVKRRVLDRIGRSDMRYVHTVTEVHSDTNRPVFNGVPVPPDEYVDEIVEGFAAVLRAVNDNKESLIELLRSHAPNIRVRVIARMTNDYAVALSGMARLGGAGNVERIVSLLRKNATGLSESMVDSEEIQLRRWMVPHFWAAADGTTIRDPWGVASGELRVAPVQSVLDKIQNVTPGDIDQQVSLIRMAFRPPEQVVVPLRGGLVPSRVGSFEEFAKGYFDALMAQQVRGNDGSVSWNSLSIDESDQLAVQPLSGGVYQGVAGVAELLAVAPQGGPHWLRLTSLVMDSLRRETEVLLDDSSGSRTYYQGPASRLGAASRLRQSVGIDAQWIETGLDRLISTLETGVPDKQLDVMGGPAGIIIALRNATSRRTVDLVRLLGNQLSDAVADGWDSKAVFPLRRNASFAHDSGGIGTALLIAAAAAEDRSLVEAWRGAWEFENTFKLAEGWRDAREEDEEVITPQWCHGLAGIALARLVWLSTIEGSLYLQGVLSSNDIARLHLEFEEAAGLIHRDLEDSGSPSLCHGVAGGALVLDLAGRRLGFDDWRVRADDLVTRAGATLSRLPWLWGSHDIRDFGMMTGPGGLILARSLLRSRTGGAGPLLPDLGTIGGLS